MPDCLPRLLPAPLLRMIAALALIIASAAAPVHAGDIKVVASFSILADLVGEVGGDRVSVTSLVKADEDAHGYQPKPSDSRLLRDAHLVVANGLGFDTWIQRLGAAASKDDKLVIASDSIVPLESEHTHGADHAGHDHGALDPHAWQDVSNARVYAANIAKALAAADPAHANDYRANLARIDKQLEELDHEIHAAMAALPENRRTIVTSHEAFAYFGRAYDIRLLAASGVSASAEPSAAGIARLIRQIRREKAAAAFLENISDPRAIERISKESGANIGGTLYSDALSGADGPAPTYVAMMRHNLETLIKALSAPRTP